MWCESGGDGLVGLAERDGLVQGDSKPAGADAGHKDAARCILGSFDQGGNSVVQSFVHFLGSGKLQVEGPGV